MIKELSKTDGPDTIVGENVTISGKLHTSGNIQINGRVEGELLARGTIIVGKTAKISGPINAISVKIEGEVDGNIMAEKEVELEAQSKVFGDIETEILSIKAGAIFNGKCTMAQSKEKQESNKQEKENPKNIEESQKEITPQIEIE